MPVISTRDLEKFSRKFGKMLGSGIPLVKSLDLIREEEADSPFGNVMEQVIARLKDGYTFSSCLAMFPGVFTSVYVAMVKAAENQGRLDSGMIEIADSCSDGTLEAAQGDATIHESSVSVEDQNLKVVGFLNEIITDAVDKKHSQVVFKPERDHVKIQIRDGRWLSQRETIDKDMYERIIARVKVMSALDISERHLPQDGRVLLKVRGEMVDVRVQLVPSIFGEQVMLFFDRIEETRPELDKVFPDEDQRNQFKSVLQDIQSGVVIFGGPTGSGKTTTLESAVAALNDGKRVIVSISPIHRSIAGITCMQLRPHIGLDMLASIRTAVRAEADVIVVDDLHDEKCAIELFKAAGQGILVLTQMSARNSAEVFRQLQNLKIPPYLIYGSVGAVFFQILVRKLCQNCSKKTRFSEEDLFRLGLTDMPAGDYSESSGCSECNNSGYLGRRPFYEITVPDKNLKEAMIRGDLMEISQALEKNHSLSLENRVREYARNGLTSLQEASRIRSILTPGK